MNMTHHLSRLGEQIGNDGTNVHVRRRAPRSVTVRGLDPGAARTMSDPLRQLAWGPR